MKKILASLLVLAMCAPAMAATVGIVDNADGTATITVTAEGADNIVGLGLDIDVTGGNATACTVDTATFDIFPDAAHDLEIVLANSYGYGDGTPIANQNAVGEAAVSNSFCVSVGALNGEFTAGATGSAAVVITLTVDADSNVCVKENALRGGIVLTTGAGEDITNGTSGVVCGPVTVSVPTECVKNTASFYGTWVDFGSPACWCFQRNCRGDANGLKSGTLPTLYVWVNSADLTILAAGYNKTVANLKAVNVGGVPGICADFNRAKSGTLPTLFVWVNSADLGILASYYNKTVASVPVCDQANYNFWMN